MPFLNTQQTWRLHYKLSQWLLNLNIVVANKSKGYQYYSLRQFCLALTLNDKSVIMNNTSKLNKPFLHCKIFIISIQNSLGTLCVVFAAHLATTHWTRLILSTCCSTSLSVELLLQTVLPAVPSYLPPMASHWKTQSENVNLFVFRK